MKGITNEQNQMFIKCLGQSSHYFLDSVSTVIKEQYTIDILKLDDYCHTTLGYTEEEHGSLSDFLEQKYGVEFRKLIELLI